MSNRADPDQIAPQSRSSLICLPYLLGLVCLKTSVCFSFINIFTSLVIKLMHVLELIIQAVHVQVDGVKLKTGF